jgi:hypothetical protein
MMYLEFGFEGSELLDEVSVGFADGSAVFNLLEASFEGPLVLLHHVGDQEGRRSWNSWVAVDQNIRGFSVSVDEVQQWGEGEGDVLVEAVFDEEMAVFDAFRDLGAVIVDWAYCSDVVLS